MIQPLHAALVFLVAFCVTWVITGAIVRRTGGGQGRSGVVTRLGGIAVLAGVTGGILGGLLSIGYSGSLSGASRYHWLGWIAGGVTLFAGGLLDDLRGLRPGAKFAVQFAGALLIYLAGFRIETVGIPGFDPIPLGPAAVPVTVLWIVGVTNAINLIDGLDGLAAGMALMAAATIAGIAVLQGVFPVAVVALALAGSLCAFLRFNTPPARIYLGDCGSQFLGFTLAVISIRGLQKSATTVALLVPVLILGVPLFDTILVILRRIWRIRADAKATSGSRIRIGAWGRIFQGDREHVHYNLLDLGLSKRRSVLLLYASAAVTCAAAVALTFGRSPAPAVVLAAVVAIEIAAIKLWAVRRRVSDARVLPGAGEPAAGENRC